MPVVFLTKEQSRSNQVSKLLKIWIVGQGTDRRQLSKNAGMKYDTLAKRIREPETCTLKELWKILDALEVPEEERGKILD